MAKNKNTILITCESGNSELFWKKSAGLVGCRIDVLVPETHYAVAIKDGKYLDTLSGGRFTVLEKSRKTLTSIDIIFLSKTHKLRILWGTKSKLAFTDAATNESFGLGASGEYEVQISSPKHFYLELVGSDEVYDAIKLKDRLQSKMLAVIEDGLRNVVNLHSLDPKTMPSYKLKISEFIEVSLSRMLELDYGLRLSSFLITNIVSAYDNAKKDDAKVKDKEELIVCTNCSVYIKKSDNFCFNCGKRAEVIDALDNQDETIRFCPRCGKLTEGEGI